MVYNTKYRLCDANMKIKYTNLVLLQVQEQRALDVDDGIFNSELFVCKDGTK